MAAKSLRAFGEVWQCQIKVSQFFQIKKKNPVKFFPKIKVVILEF